jgi:uncharacterized protein
MLAVHTWWFQIPCRWAAAVGRTALSNYLFQTLVCTFIFYGNGLGCFGHLDQIDQMVLVMSIWAGEVLLSIRWLKAFGFGPAEWVLRAFTYGKIDLTKRRLQPQ